MVVDDVLTKGTTSTKSIRRIKEENPAKVDFCSVFSYEMKSMYDNFKEIGITPNSLIRMDLITLEILEDLFKPEDLEILLNFIK